MKLFFKLNNYEQSIEIEYGEITKWNCLCKDFEIRQVHKDPIGQCKHIISLIKNLDKDFLNNITDKPREQDLCELCNKPNTGEYHMSDECVYINEEQSEVLKELIKSDDDPKDYLFPEEKEKYEEDIGNRQQDWVK